MKAEGRSEPANYVLVLWNRRKRSVKVGRLGPIEFEPGFYVYVGSGGANPLKRVQRHLRAAKPRRWHVDYITTGPARMRPVDSYVLAGGSECRTARRIGRRLAVVSRFGSSDCRCPGHLFHAPGLPELNAALDPVLPGKPGRQRTTAKRRRPAGRPSSTSSAR